MFIPDSVLDLDFLLSRILDPDPRLKKAPDPGSATLFCRERIGEHFIMVPLLRAASCILKASAPPLSPPISPCNTWHFFKKNMTLPRSLARFDGSNNGFGVGSIAIFGPTNGSTSRYRYVPVWCKLRFGHCLYSLVWPSSCGAAKYLLLLGTSIGPTKMSAWWSMYSFVPTNCLRNGWWVVDVPCWPN